MDNGQFYAALGILWVFGLIVVSIVGWHLRSKRLIEKLKIVHEERMRALEKGIPLPEFPEFNGDVNDVGKSGSWNPRWPLGAGALLITGGVGSSVALALAQHGFEELWPFGLIAVFLGVGMFLFYGLTRTPSAKD